MIWAELYPQVVIPLLLIGLSGWLLLRGEPPRAGSRFLLVLLGATALLLLFFLVSPGFESPYDRFTTELPIILMPTIIALLVLIAMFLKWVRVMSSRARIIALVLMVAIAVLLGLQWNSRLSVSLILPGALILFVTWSLGWRFGWLPEALGLISLGTLLLFMFLQLEGILQTLPAWVRVPLGIFYYLNPIILVVFPALLLARELQQRSSEGGDDPNRLSRDRSALRALLAFFMLGALSYAAFRGGIWDQTIDLGIGFMIPPFGTIAALVAGLVMALTLSGKYRIAGLVYMFLIPTILLRAYDAGRSISHHALTEQYAERIAQSLEQFHAREGYYPETLDALTPGDLLYVPQPVLLLGEKWCYRGGQDFYQLAAIYREYWSLPLSLRTYASAGEPPAGDWECEERLIELKARYDPPPFVGAPETVSTPVPLPTSVITIQKEEVQPILSAHTLSIGTWSPDDRYLMLGLPQIADGQSVIELGFLDAETGEFCPVEGSQPVTSVDYELREHHVWLPDGHLLYVSPTGDMTLLSPCEPVTVSLTDSYPVAFTHALAHHEPSGRVLLKNQESFWILDGSSMELIPIASATPNPYELHWDRFSWSPGGGRLAISRLNGQTAREGSTLFIVEAETGRVERELPLDSASDQSAPFVVWMSEEELLVHASGALFLIDLRTDPPEYTDVFREIFLLDLSYPDDITSFAWEGHHLSVRVNHPRNQDIYIYHPETGEVEIIQPGDASPLLFFPNGEMVEMASYPEEPSGDQYELIWIDAPDAPSRVLSVQGHLPRNYPQLFPRYLPEASTLVFGSSQGVSLLSMPDGEALGFWELGGGGSISPYVLPSSDYPALVVAAEGDGLYYIPLPGDQ